MRMVLSSGVLIFECAPCDKMSRPIAVYTKSWDILLELLQLSQRKNMSISDAIITAKEMVAELGTQAVSIMDQRAHAHDAVGHWEDALFWRQVAWAARLLAPSAD